MSVSKDFDYNSFERKIEFKRNTTILVYTSLHYLKTDRSQIRLMMMDSTLFCVA